MSVASILSAGVGGLLITTAAWAAAVAPAVVSPGGPKGTRIGQSCPTFSWAGVDDAVSYELIVLALDEGVATETELLPESAPEPDLRVRLPGAASSWTPSLDQCLTSGRRYAWLVRSLPSRGEPGEWSSPGVFEIVPRLETTCGKRGGRQTESPSGVAPPVGAAEPVTAQPQDLSASVSRTSTDGIPTFSAGPFPGNVTGSLVSRSSPDSSAFALTAIGGELAAGDRGWAVSGFANDGTGLYGNAGTNNALGFSGSPIGVWGVAGEITGAAATAVQGDNYSPGGQAGLFTSYWPGGRGLEVYAATGNDLALMVGAYDGDDGLIGSEPYEPSSDIIVISNDAVAVRLDNDGDGEDADFEVTKGSALLFNVDESGAIRLLPTDTPELCDANAVGGLYYDLSLGLLCVCNGSGWKQVDGGADC